MFETIVLSLLFTPQFVTPPPSFSDQLDHVEIVDGGGDVQLIGYDQTGAVIGSIALWIESDGTTWAVSDYADGFSAVVVYPDGHLRLDGGLAPKAVADRAELLIAALDGDPGQERWIKCAALTGVMVGTCATGSLIACPFSAMAAACECLPKLEPKWKNKSCS